MDNSSSLTPEVIHSLFQSACQFHQEGRFEEAKSVYLQLLEHIDAPLLHYNLGLIYHSTQETELACDCFEHAHAGNPEDTDSLFNLALCQKNCGKFAKATESYLKLLDFDPHNIDALYNLAGCYREQRKDEQAIALYLKVLQLAPEHHSATSNLAYMYQLTDNTEQAIRYYQKLLELAPDNEAAGHMLASLLGTSSLAPPESYVRNLFNNYSDHYEESLVKNLQYDVPLQLRQHFNTLQVNTKSFKYGIDIGCGTGLSGLAFKDIVTVLDGVDISEKMIALAEGKCIYRSLVVSSIASALRQTVQTYDFVIAADVFAYLGDLEETFQLLSACTQPGGHFFFSTESGNTAGYSLRSSGRYTHGTEYIYALARKFGWLVELQQSTNLRMERGGWVIGNLWILRKQDTSHN